MFLRLLFIVLVALNIAMGAWLLLGQPYAHVGSATDAGVPELRLLSEMPESVATSPGPSDTGGLAADATHRYICITLGPFNTPQDLRNARQALAGQVARTRSRQQQTGQNAGWWVYLPTVASRTQALEQARQLEAHGIDDYFVVGSGDQANTISLGVFKDPANARKRLDQVLAAGFSARMGERSGSAPEYWLDLMVSEGTDLDWRSHVSASGIDAHRTGCF
ncbi:MAG: SPOR domain-containing protein [Rhodanobacter sp.]